MNIKELYNKLQDEYPGMYYIGGKTYKATKEDFLKKVNDYCPIRYIGYGPTAKDKSANS
jgi:hypothetical protein